MVHNIDSKNNEALSLIDIDISSITVGMRLHVVVKSNHSANESKENFTHQGVVLPRSSLFDQHILVLKLDSGYNIGISHDSILSVRLEQTALEVTQQHIKSAGSSQSQRLVVDTSLPKVAFLSFGGTISSRLDYKTGGVVADYGASDFYAMCPELSSIAQIEAKTVAKIMSEDMTPNHWQTIVASILPYVADDSVAGIVVTQGTDTLHFSTSAVSFALSKVLNKPIIFTASQRSIDRGSTDAFENIICAVHAAAHFDGAVVATCMHESSSDGACLLIRGTKVRKMHTSRRDSFRPINARALAQVRVNGDITILSSNYPKRNTQISLGVEMSEGTVNTISAQFGKCGLLYVYPGIDVSQIQVFADESYKGLIIAATALGHIPEYIMDAVGILSSQKPIFITSQTLYGRVHPFVYSRLREQSVVLGLTFLDDMLPETAYAKLSYAVATFATVHEIVAFMKENIAGEYSGEIDAECFLN
jgi:glutamyl-tRNA(Gln) amidotransferase subunit D